MQLYPQWHEKYPSPYEPEDGNVSLSAFGNNLVRGRLIEAKSGYYLGSVVLPIDFYLASNLDEHSVVNAYVAAYSKDLAVNPAENDVLSSEERPEHDEAYSFVRAAAGKAVELLSIEQARLLKVLLEKERSLIAKPKSAEQDWLVLHWVKRQLPISQVDDRG